MPDVPLSPLLPEAQRLLPEAQRAAAQAAETGAAAGGLDSGTLVLLLTIFALAVFVGFEIITKIPPTLHTPLMSGSNAISGITLMGALLALDVDHTGLAKALGFLAIVLATMNVVGGFLVTHRMLGMFQRKK
ncbi:MAG TPA: NAD(P) transhydrogenase subunit alpha [Planctomycetaceae bacterium]|nr:NAD(P) transhydrogenase subunit alpha [Planctomycetaceae bacterium]